MLRKITSNQLFIPIAALLLLVVFNLIRDLSFYAISIAHTSDGNPILQGQIINILDNGSELAILAIGMTIVTAASGGQDISVGATVAIVASVVLKVVCGDYLTTDTVQNPIILAFLLGLIAAVLCGAFNGALVAFFKIPPMVATLILFTAGRSIAAWVNNNRTLSISDPSFGVFGKLIPGCPIPVPIFIALGFTILTYLVLKFTTLGLYTQAVGINESSSKLNGINPKLIKFLSFVILGLCVAVVGFIQAARMGNVTYSVVAKDIEMDAILAVALGGNSLSGGKFNIGASILGAYVIQFLKTTLLACEVSAPAIQAYKAVVVILLVVLSSTPVRAKLEAFGKKFDKKEVA